MYEELAVLSGLVDTLEGMNPSAVQAPEGFWDDLIKRIRDAIATVINAVGSSIRGVVNTAKDYVAGKVISARDTLDNIINSVGSSIRGTVNTTKNFLADTISNISGSIKSHVTSTVNGISTGITNTVNTIKTHVTSVVTGIQTGVTNTVNTIKSAVTSAVNSASNTITGVVNNVKSTLSSAIGSARTAIEGGINSVSSALSNGISVLGSAVTNVKDSVLGAINSTMGNVGDAILTAVGWLVDKIDGVITAVKNIGSTIGNAIAQALGNIGSFITTAVQNAIEAASGLVTTAVTSMKETLNNIVGSISDTINGLISGVSDWLGNIYQGLKEFVASAVETVQNVFTQVKETLEDKIQKFLDWLNAAVESLTEFFWQTVSNMAKWIAENFLPAWAKAVDWAQQITGLDPSVLEDIKKGDFSKLSDGIGNIFEWAGNAALNSPLYAIALAIANFWNTVALQFVPSQVAAAKQANIALGLDPVSIEGAAAAVFRGQAGLDDFYANARLAGVTQDRAKMILEASKALPTPGAVQEAFLRGEISEDEHDRMLADYGYSGDNIDLFKTLYFFIPPPNDLIRMAVREAFSPEIAEKFGQFEDYPDIFTTWAERQGVSKDWAERYWASHWDLPSPQMGFEMLHRGVIDTEELTLLLRALDVMPYWRERLIQISYNPITRVDVRRMYKMGVLDEAQVYRAYLDLGYDEEKAGWLVEFTKRYSAPEDENEMDKFRALARSTYSAAYKKKIINKNEYKVFLSEMGYHPDDIELLVSIDDFSILQTDKLFDLGDYRKDWQKLALRAYDRGLIGQEEISIILSDLGYEPEEVTLELSLLDYNRRLVLRDILTKQISEQYIEFIIDETRVYEILNSFEYTSNEIDRLLEEWNIERHFRTKRPTLTDLKRFLDAELITMGQFLDELRGLGYNEKYIGLYEAFLS